MKYSKTFTYNDNAAYFVVYNFPDTKVRMTWYCDKTKKTRDLILIYSNFNYREFLLHFDKILDSITPELFEEILDSAVNMSTDQRQEHGADEFMLKMTVDERSSTYIKTLEGE